MQTRIYPIMILKEPLLKWDKDNRATTENPNIYCSDGHRCVLMMSKLRKILHDHGEHVAIDNALVLTIIDAYIKKSHKLKVAKKRIAELEAKIKAHDSAC